MNPIVSIYCSTTWQTSASIPSVKASIIWKVAYLSRVYNKLEVSNSAISKEIKLQLLLLLGLPSECGLYNISSVLTPFTLNYLAAVKTNQSYYSTVFMLPFHCKLAALTLRYMEVYNLSLLFISYNFLPCELSHKHCKLKLSDVKRWLNINTTKKFLNNGTHGNINA